MGVQRAPVGRGATMMRKQKGFSLIELLIVVAIILIIAAIAVPSFLRSRMAANEASAVGTIRTITTAEVTYSATNPAIGYTDLITLGGALPCAPSTTSACLVDAAVSTGNPKSGYAFAAAPAGAQPYEAYSVNGNPVACGSSGIRTFYADTPHVIRFDGSGVAAGCPPANAASPTLE